MGSIKGVPRGKYSIRIIQPGGRVYCYYCNKNFKRKLHLTEHIRITHLNHRVICHVCGKKYISTSTRNRHLRKVHNISKQTDLTNSSHAFHASADNSPLCEYFEFDRNRAFPCMANVLSLNENKTFGKHIVANRNIDVGKMVIVSKPFASIETLSSIGSNCFQCGKSWKKNFIECPHCTNVLFCSKRCSLSKEHLSKCDRMFFRDDCHIVRLTVKIIQNTFEMVNDHDTLIEFVKGVLFSKKKPEKCIPPYSSYGELLNLKGSIQENQLNMVHRVMKYTSHLLDFNEASKKRILFFLACKHINSLQINSFSEEVKLSKGTCTRYFIHDVLSRANHSCEPNVHHFYNDHDDNNIIYGQTTRQIKKGEQIFINYLGRMTFTSNDIRRKYIKDLWSFDCTCNKCKI